MHSIRTLSAALLASLLTLASTCTAAGPDAAWRLLDLGEGLHALEIDSIRTRSLVVEFDSTLALVEVGLSSKGGGARTLTEDRASGEALLGLLRERFPGKPLEAVLHSHWHPHSLASAAPFLEAGVPLVTTRATFARTAQFVDTLLTASRPELLRFVEDTLRIGRGLNEIVAHRLAKADYPSLPTADYLFFHLPGRALLQCGCMYSRREGEVDGRPLLYPRTADLHRWIADEGLAVDGLVRLEYGAPGESAVLPGEELRRTAEEGVTLQELVAPWRALSTDSLRAGLGELAADALRRGLPGSLFNGLVFDAFAERDLERARQLALLQALVAPHDPNAWDTLGEVLWFLGDEEPARAYDRAARRLDPAFLRGGPEAWEKDHESLRARWAKADGAGE